jgi:hypothetical protein
MLDAAPSGAVVQVSSWHRCASGFRRLLGNSSGHGKRGAAAELTSRPEACVGLT